MLSGVEDVDFLRRWLRFDTTCCVFPREVGRYRDVVEDFDGFLAWYYENRFSDFCWSGLYSMDQISKSCYDTLFLDFDFSRDGMIDMSCFNVLSEIVSYFSNLFPRVRLYYSGFKGFHVYLDFGREIFFYNFRDAAREFVKRYLSGYVLPDMVAVGDVRRMVRVVGNVRVKEGVERKMIELCRCGGVDDLIEQVNGGGRVCGCMSEVVSGSDVGVDVLVSIDEELANSRVEKIDSRILSSQSLEKIPPCVVNCFTELVDTGELNHSGRVLLSNWLIWSGFSDDDVVDVFRVAKDFKERYTRYQVEFLRRKRYKLPACKKIMSDGYCPYRCEFYPWMNGDKHEGVKRG